jgi:hypothetical protein
MNGYEKPKEKRRKKLTRNKRLEDNKYGNKK